MLVNTYITVKNQTNINLLQEKIQSLNNKFGGDWAAKYFRFELQPIRAIHLHSNLLAEYAPQTNISLIYIFSAIGFLILIIASINYINLTIAIFNRRIQEIGIRKALGANRFRIGLQFMGESFFLVLISFFISLALVKLFFPVFSTVIPGEIQLNFNQGLVIACGITFALAALSGIYPAFHLSSLHTHLLIRGKNRRVPSSPMIRKMLIGFQFTIAIVLVIATSVIYSQMHYIINKDVRFDKKQLIRIPVYRQQLKSRLESLKTEFLKVPGVVSVSVSSSVPFESTQFRAFRPEGFQDKEISSSVILVDQDYIKTYAMEIISGQNFSVENPKGYIINETAAKRFGWTDPIGKEIEWAAGDRIGGIDKERVIGVVKDFHFENFRKEIQPLVLRVRPEYFNLLTVRYNRSDVAGMLSQLKQVWEKFDNEFPFNYSFLDEVFNKTYGDEKRLTGELLYLSIISILIASMGLCGLISFMAQQKTKEIGIRKVHGATKTSIVFLLTKDFLKLVIVANVIAWPMSYYLANGWLNNFIYRTSINPIIFIGASVVVLIIALFTISFQSIKAAMANPADSLKYE